MTVIGDDIIFSCRKCFSTCGFGVRLQKSGDYYSCGHCRARYKVNGGLMETA